MRLVGKDSDCQTCADTVRHRGLYGNKYLEITNQVVRHWYLGSLPHIRRGTGGHEPLQRGA